MEVWESPVGEGCELSGLTPRGLVEHEAELFVSQPRDADRGFVEASGSQERVVGSFLEVDADRFETDFDEGGCVDEVAEQVAGFGVFIAVADLRTEKAV